MAFKNRKLTLQKLETRKLRAADIFLDGDIVEIIGTEGSDVAEVRFHEDHVHIDLTYPDPDGSGTDHIDERYDIADISQIRFTGLGDDDTMTMEVDDLDANISLDGVRAYFFGGNDDDTFDNDTAVRSYAYGEDGSDTLLGGSGYDYLYGGRDNDILNGREGNDQYIFSGADLGSDTILEVAGQGTDSINLRGLELTNNSSNDLTFLDLGATYEQYVYYAYNNEHFKLTLEDGEAIENAYGTDVSDYFYGNGQNNRLYGYDGDDFFKGGGGDDRLYGDDGNDFLWGERGSDRLYGRDGFDFLIGDEYNYDLQNAYYAARDANGEIAMSDLLDEMMNRFGGNDLKELDDALHASALNTSQSGYGARDYIYGGNDTDVAFGGSGNDYIRGDREDDLIIGGTGADDLYGDMSYSSTYRQGADYLFGLDGTDDLFGRGGDDWLFGGNGADHLEGNDGNDLLYGRHDGSADTLVGGAGNDRFVRYYYNGGGRYWTQDPEEDEVDYTTGEDYLGYVYL